MRAVLAIAANVRGEVCCSDFCSAGQFYKASTAPSSTDTGKYDGYFYATRVYNAVYNDYAELFECSADMPEVGMLAYAGDDGRVSAAGEPCRAVGVRSDRYAFLIGGEDHEDGAGKIAVALAGRVPLLAPGVKAGDMVAARCDGTGRRANPADFGLTVGKCVGPDPLGREGYVEVLVGVM